MILLRRYLSILVKKGWAHELDHTGGGTGHVVHDRAGRGLSVRALHTRSGKLRKRERPPAPRSELLASREARSEGKPDQNAARSHRRARPAPKTPPPPPLLFFSRQERAAGG